MLDTKMVVVLALGVSWMHSARSAQEEIFAQKTQKPPNVAKPAYRLKVLKVSTIKGGLALKVLLRAPKYVKA